MKQIGDKTRDWGEMSGWRKTINSLRSICFCKAHLISISKSSMFKNTTKRIKILNLKYNLKKKLI